MRREKLDARYQAAILHNGHVLLIKVWDHTFTGQTFWTIPGGGRQPGESEEECVRREAWEETNLRVEVDRLLLETPDAPDGLYERLKTYACRIAGGEPRPGSEPEVDSAERRTIQAVGWFDLRDPASWDPLARNDPITLAMLLRLRAALGYVDKT
jgi:8-oxo-dGTP pyrophosphatase MutT (NUDIX family)